MCSSTVNGSKPKKLPNSIFAVLLQTNPDPDFESPAVLDPTGD